MYIEPSHEILSIAKQTELLGLNRSSYYFKPVKESVQNLLLMNLIDEEFTAHPFLWKSQNNSLVEFSRPDCQ